MQKDPIPQIRQQAEQVLKEVDDLMPQIRQQQVPLRVRSYLTEQAEQAQKEVEVRVTPDVEYAVDAPNCCHK